MEKINGPDVYRAICDVAKAISRDGIAKSKNNQQQGYKFRGIDDIYNALSAVIAGAELCILPRMAERLQEERATKTGGLLFYVTVRAEFDFVSARDGSKHTVTMYGEAMDSADKATNKAMSAAYKYACLQVFCIPTEGMEDADAHTPDPQAKEHAKSVADSKIEQMKKGVPYNKTKVQDGLVPDAPPSSDESLSPVSFKQMLQQFATIKKAMGDKEYYKVLGVNGFEHANEIQNRQVGLRIYKEMVFRFNELKLPVTENDLPVVQR